jgi:transposase-like protein
MGTNFKFYVKNGFTSTQKPPFLNQRFKCKGCKIQFSQNTFDIDFRKQVVKLGEKVLEFSMNGMSNNSVARQLHVAEGTVRNRLKVLSRQALYFEKEHAATNLNEDVAFDGFETFTHSQFSPCYVNTAVGSTSMFIYHNTLSPLNRKGRMTEQQKIKNLELIAKFGHYPRDSVYEESCYVFSCLSSIGSGRTLFTDEHKSYQRATKNVSLTLKHQMINSQVRRDPTNPLFPVNRLHNLYRHFFSSQKRETIAFQKHEAALLEKIQLMKIYQNFMRPKFVKKNKFDPKAHEWSPAMYVGVANKVLSFSEIFGVRKLSTQVKLDSREKEFIQRHYPYSRQNIAV